jgi:hypothetical protein
MSLSDDPIIPSDPPPTPPLQNPSAASVRGRRRRAMRREMFPKDAEGQAAFISDLSRRAYPSFELFVFSILCGAILGLGYLLDSQAVLLLGILITPLMTPWVGFLLATITGKPRFLFETLMALLISAVLVFLGGLLSGFAARLFENMVHYNVSIHSRLWIPELVVLIVGAITLVASFVRSESKPFLPSVVIAYAFYLPVSAGGFGLGSGLPGIFPQGLLVSAAHFALASVIGLITLFLLRLRPTAAGIFFSLIALILFGGLLFNLMGTGFPLRIEAGGLTSALGIQATPLPASRLTPSLPPTTTSSPRPSSTPTPKATASSSTPDVNQSPSAVPLTLELTLPATETPTITMTVAPKPIFGKISANEGGGANLRQTPSSSGKYIMTLGNGMIVEIFPEFRVVNGITWIHVFVTANGQRIEGWLLESTVTYATPEPNFEPSATATVGLTATP